MEETCGFDRAWQSPCDNQTPCKKHKDAKCDVCGKDAVKACDEASSFVCGAFLCEKCSCWCLKKKR